MDSLAAWEWLDPQQACSGGKQHDFGNFDDDCLNFTHNDLLAGDGVNCNGDNSFMLKKGPDLSSLFDNHWPVSSSSGNLATQCTTNLIREDSCSPLSPGDESMSSASSPDHSQTDSFTPDTPVSPPLAASARSSVTVANPCLSSAAAQFNDLVPALAHQKPAVCAPLAPQQQVPSMCRPPLPFSPMPSHFANQPLASIGCNSNAAPLLSRLDNAGGPPACSAAVTATRAPSSELTTGIGNGCGMTPAPVAVPAHNQVMMPSVAPASAPDMPTAPSSSTTCTSAGMGVAAVNKKRRKLPAEGKCSPAGMVRSESPDDEEDGRPENKDSKRERNKVSAMKYRKRRKMYLDTLEDKVTALTNDVQSLSTENKMLKEQLQFLRGLLCMQTNDPSGAAAAHLQPSRAPALTGQVSPADSIKPGASAASNTGAHISRHGAVPLVLMALFCFVLLSLPFATLLPSLSSRVAVPSFDGPRLRLLWADSTNEFFSAVDRFAESFSAPSVASVSPGEPPDWICPPAPASCAAAAFCSLNSTADQFERLSSSTFDRPPQTLALSYA